MKLNKEEKEILEAYESTENLAVLFIILLVQSGYL